MGPKCVVCALFPGETSSFTLSFSDLSFGLFPRIDKKMSDAQGSYKLDEAQAVLRETKAIKKAITCGEKEKQDLIKVRKFQ